MLDILTIGDIKLDTFLTLTEATVTEQTDNERAKLCLEYGKKIPVTVAASQIAGSAPNIAVALAKMNKKSAVLSVMGQDMTFAAAKEFLKGHKVSTSYITAQAKKRSSFAAVVNFNGESTQLVAHSPADMRLPVAPPTRWFHVCELGPGFEKLFRDVIHAVKGTKTQVSFNPGQMQIDDKKKVFFDLIAICDVLFLNLREARELLALPEAPIAGVLKKARALGARTVVITDGQNGAYAYSDTDVWHAPMFPGKRVEATGAGDAFAAGYIGAILHKQSPLAALAWGSVNAAAVVNVVGPTAGLLTHTEIIKRLRTRPQYNPRAL